MSQLTFEKSITRDWGLIYAEIWHRVFTEEFKRQLGWGYTEVVFEGKENTVSVYRAPSEHIDSMRQFILGYLDKDSGWLARHAETVRALVDATVAWVDDIRHKPYEKYTARELADVFRSFIERNVELGPRFIIMLWFPIQMENHLRAQKYHDAIQRAIETRVHVEKIGPLVDTFAREIATEVARRAGLPAEVARFMSSSEVVGYLDDGAIPDVHRLLDERRYFLVTNGGIVFDPIEQYLKRHGYVLRKIEVQDVREFRGTPAYAGIARGIVKIIRNKDMFGKFNDGDVLVTGMTTPDFLSIMKKSAAFVTDEGGITCHAAIVAREMNKPCIIGTKIATQALKDGDEVEVDAEKGVVRVLKRSA